MHEGTIANHHIPSRSTSTLLTEIAPPRTESDDCERELWKESRMDCHSQQAYLDETALISEKNNSPLTFIFRIFWKSHRKTAWPCIFPLCSANSALLSNPLRSIFTPCAIQLSVYPLHYPTKRIKLGPENSNLQATTLDPLTY